jgi:hypothetical protein
MNTPQERQEKLNILKSENKLKRLNKNILLIDVSLVLIIGTSILSVISLF